MLHSCTNLSMHAVPILCVVRMLSYNHRCPFFHLILAQNEQIKNSDNNKVSHLYKHMVSANY